MQNTISKAHQSAETIFRTILPAYGLVVRDAQIDLCHEMLDALFGRKIALCDAGVGIGKTYAYLIAGVLWQKFSPTTPPQPIAISTSSVALQNAIINEYLPLLSCLLVEYSLLDAPLQAVVRKGKERYVCDQRLAERLAHLPQKDGHGQRKKSLIRLQLNIDLDAATGLSNYERRLVCVPSHCLQNCEKRADCRFHQYVAQSKECGIDIQICNHNFLLADAAHRLGGRQPLLADYRALIVDEAHKLPDAALQMQTKCVAPADGEELCVLLEEEGFTVSPGKLREAFGTVWRLLGQGTASPGGRVSFHCDGQLRNALQTAARYMRQVAVRMDSPTQRWIVDRLEQKAGLLALFYTENTDYVLYIQYDRHDNPSLCAASREVATYLHTALWANGKPAILTSGTLAAGGSFARYKAQCGLAQAEPVREFRAASPFDYEQNCLLHFPESVPKHPHGSEKEAADLAQRIREITAVTHGHALILFTSYDLMARVHERLKDTLPFPLLAAWRGGQSVLQEFRATKNAVLLAAGPCWEGVDFPGDLVSLLVIVRLPFPVPDPLREAEMRRYNGLQSYIDAPWSPQRCKASCGRALAALSAQKQIPA